MNRKMFIAIIIAGMMLAILGFVAQYFWLSPVESETAVLREGKTEGVADIGGEFKLIDHRGKERTPEDFKGKYLLIYFGYSYCPDICPTALYSMTQALEKLGAQARKIQPLFITIDPQRDTIKALSLYMQNYHSSFIGLTGEEAAIKEAMKAYRVYAKKVDDAAATDYLMDHSSIIYLMDPTGVFVEHFNHLTPADDLVKALKKYL